MDHNIVKLHFQEAQQVLDQFIQKTENFDRIVQAGKVFVEALNKGNKIISCGNGGSMSDAMHFAEELTGRYRENRPSLPALAISDPSYLSCAANDYGYEQVFSRFIEGVGTQGDVLLAISTSGNSENIVQAAQCAHHKGMMVVGLTGKSGGKLASVCDVEIRAPQSPYADRVQEIHIKVIHSLIDFIEQKCFPR